MNASTGSSYTFRILVEDPTSTGLGSDGAATVDALVAVSDFWGGLLDYTQNLTEFRELQPPFGYGSLISNPFILLSLIASAVVGDMLEALRRILEFEWTTKVQLIEFSVMVLVFFGFVGLYRKR